MTPQDVGRARVAASGRSPGPTTQDAPQTPPTRAQRLAQDAAEAAEVREHQTDPDVIALRVGRVRLQVDRMCWTGIVLGLCFTRTNVQHFAAAKASAWSLPWLAAWLRSDCAAGLLPIPREEQLTARYQAHTGRWVRAAKWLALGSTYLMNTWTSYGAGSAAAIALHSVPPLMVFATAEAVTDLPDKLTETATVALTEAAVRSDEATKVNAAGVHRPATPAPMCGSRRRKLFADYLADAHAVWTPVVDIPRRGCGRSPGARAACPRASRTRWPRRTMTRTEGR